MAKKQSKSLAARFLPARFNKSLKVVPVVHLNGVIATGGTSLRQSLSLASCGKLLDKAFSIKGIAAVAIAINSPGGSPAQAALIHNRIRQLAGENEVPVYTFCEDVAASGGYMLAIAGDEVFGQRFSIIGSIGVISAGFGFVEAIGKLGVERRVHTAGQNKSILDPFQPEKKQDVERLKALQLDIHQGFVEMVKARRKAKLPADEGDLFTGAFWTSPQALEHGLIDNIGDMHAVLREKFGEDVVLKPITASQGLSLRRLLPVGSTSDHGAIDVKLNGDFAEGLAHSMERRALWQRFGL